MLNLFVCLTQGTQQSNVPECSNEHFSQLSDRFDCFPRGIASEQACMARGCCWKPVQANSLEPWCFYPNNYKSYQIETVQLMGDGQTSLVYRNIHKSTYPDDVEYVRVDVVYETEKRLRVKIYDAKNKRYEPPYPKFSKQNKFSGAHKYNLELAHLQDSNFGFAVVRKYPNRILFDTRNVGGFTMADQFLQISTKLSSYHLYGLGEVRKPLANNFNWTSIGLFAHDLPPIPYKNLYGSHPFYLAMEEDGKSHGVLLHNSNALEITLQPTPAITYRAIGGVLDFYFFLGENPEEVVQEYLQFIGKPNLPPYWTLGFHISRYGWSNTSEVEDVLQRTLQAGIPLDVLYGDIDYMDRHLDFTYDKVNYATLPHFIETLHSMGLKYVPILDPGIDTDQIDYAPFEEGKKLKIFIENQDGQILRGKVWNPGHTAFPDFTHPKAYEYWSSQLKRFYSEIKFDGIWIDMNEPANFEVECTDSKWDNPPYMPRLDDPMNQGLKYKTICMSTKQYAGLHYNVHNIYGISQSEVTFKAVEGILKKRPFILARSTFPGSGRYVSHWTGDVYSDWDSMKQSVADMILGGIFGTPMIGADICGFKFNTTMELCARWSQLGAFYPFSRNHNDIESAPHDPAAPNMGPVVKEAARKALLLRYTLLPYLYTLLHKANRYGLTVVRPLFFEFPNDKITYDIEDQFLWGSGLLIAPVLKQGDEKVDVYLPNGTWYSYPNFDKKWVAPTSGLRTTLDAPIMGNVPLIMRGGFTIVIQTPDVTTTKSRLNNFQIIAALDVNDKSQGDLFWDDGDTPDPEDYNFIELTAKDGCLQSTVRKFNHECAMKIDDVKIVGVREKIAKVSISILQTKHSLSFNMDEETKVLSIDMKNVDVTFETNFIICWSA